MKITKAVFPVAGLGTRFLPATKANPKEMMPIVDKPLIQFAAEEAVRAGITQLIFVTSSSKRAIEDHFDSNFELEAKLQERQRMDTLKVVREILPEGVSCAYVRQTDPLGLGHAIWCTKTLIGNEPFAVLLADDLIDAQDPGCLAQMVAIHQTVQAPVVAVERVAREDVHKYGIVGVADSSSRCYRMKTIIEKPQPENAPSNLAAVGRYILTPAIFEALENIPRGAGGEIQLTDAIASTLKTDPVYAYEFTGKRYDCGSKLGYVKATLNYARRHPEVGEAFEAYLKGVFVGEGVVAE